MGNYSSYMCLALQLLLSADDQRLFKRKPSPQLTSTHLTTIGLFDILHYRTVSCWDSSPGKEVDRMNIERVFALIAAGLASIVLLLLMIISIFRAEDVEMFINRLMPVFVVVSAITFLDILRRLHRKKQ